MTNQFKTILLLGEDAFYKSFIADLQSKILDVQVVSAVSLEEASTVMQSSYVQLVLSPLQLIDGAIVPFLAQCDDTFSLIFVQSDEETKMIESSEIRNCFPWLSSGSINNLILLVKQLLIQEAYQNKINHLSIELQETQNKLLQSEMKHTTADLFHEKESSFSKAEHQLVQEALRESELMYRTLFESAPVGMCLATIDGNVFGYNEAMHKLIGDSTERSLENFNLSQLFPRSEDYDNLLHEVQTMGFIRDIEGELVNSEGYVFYAIMNITFLTIDEEDFLLTVFEDITMRKLAEEKLADYTEQLREANTELYQYAYAVAHDIRAPLRAIRNYADFLDEDLSGNLQEEQQEYLDNMVKSVSDAEQFVADLLELSRVGRREVDIESVDLKTLIRDLVASLDLDENMHVHYPEDLPAVMGERTLLKQVFLNLITNGMKFNQSDNKNVNFSWQALDSQTIEIRVQDNGIGIKPEYYEQIFRVFERLHTKQEYDGTGVGLAIVKKAIVKMQGQVQLESVVGQGSTFVIFLLKAN